MGCKMSDNGDCSEELKKCYDQWKDKTPCPLCEQAGKRYEELNRKYQELALSVETKYGCWLCPSCMIGAPSGQICRECLEKDYAKLKAEVEKTQKHYENARTDNQNYLNQITRLQSQLKSWEEWASMDTETFKKNREENDQLRKRIAEANSEIERLKHANETR